MADQVIYIPVILRKLKPKGSVGPTDIIGISDANGNILFKTTVQQLVQNSGISFTGNVAGIAKSNTTPAAGASPESQIIYFAGSGTYENFPDENGNPIVATANFNAISWDGTKAELQSIQIDVDMAPYALNGGSDKTVKELDDDQVKNYQFKYFIQNIQVPNLTINGSAVTDDIETKRVLIGIEKAITKFETFKLLKDKYLIFSQFTFTPGGAISIGISVAGSETEEVGFTASYTKFFQSITPTGNAAKFKMGIKANSMRFNLLIDFDTSLLGPDTISLNTQNGDSNVSYSRSGILTQNIRDIYTYKAFWGRDFLWFSNAGGGSSSTTDRTDNINAYNAVQDIQVTSNDPLNDRLLQIHQLSYTAGALTFIMWSCLDDDPQNLEVTTDRNGFRYYRLQVPTTDTGLKKYISFPASGTGDPELTVSMVIDNDILHNGIADLTTFDARTSLFTAQYLVKKKASGSDNPDGHYTQLSLLSDDEIEIYNWRWNSGGTNYSAGSGYKYKICAVPEGTTEMVFNGVQDGADFKVLMYDKNLAEVEFTYDGGDGTINTQTYIPPAEAKFFRVISGSKMEVIANGDFIINTTSIKEYRSIHAGLCDKYSGKIFSVAGRLFWKDKDGICDLREYRTSDDGYLSTLPTLSTDGVLITPMNVLHKDGATPFNGGYLCDVKDGVMYFQNEHEQAVFISEDDGATHRTLFDKYSHPDIFNLGAGEISQLNNRPGVIVMDNGELLITAKSGGDLIDDPRKERRQVFNRMYRTTNNRSDLVPCFKFSYESTLNDWDPAKPLWGNWVYGGILSKYSFDTWRNLIVVTEYGASTPKWWADQGISKNGNGIVGRAWISFDYGATFKKMFDADRKISGTSEDDDNWYYWRSKYNRMQMHPHSIRIDKTRRVISICNGDGDDFVFECPIDTAKSWYDTAPVVDPDEKPEYKVTDTFPEWSTFQTNYDSADSKIIIAAYANMTGQLMSVVSTGFGLAGMHDARRDALLALYYNSFGERIFEPTFWFEQMEDYATQDEWVKSWVTEAFVQDDPKHEGIIYMVHTGGKNIDGSERPARIWATVNGITCKKLYEGTQIIGFGGALNFDRGNIYLSPKVGATSIEDGYYRFTQVPV